MRRIVYFLLALAVSSCMYDDFFPTIKGYESKWEYDLKDYYPSSGTFADYLQVFQIIKSDNGSFVVASRNGASPLFNEGIILTKLDANGSVIKDVHTKTSYGRISNTTVNGNILFFHLDTLSTYNTELVLTSNLVMNLGTEYYEVLAIEGGNIIITRYRNGKKVLVDYDQAGRELWEVFNSLGCGCTTLLELCFNQDKVGIASVPLLSDTAKVSYVNLADGSQIWNRQFLKSVTHLEGQSITPVWTSNVLNLISSANKGVDIRLISLDDEIVTRVLSARLPEGSVIRKAIVTKDGGILIGVGTNTSVDVANFRLIKLNRIGNIVWEGAFYQLGVDSLADLVELENGLVIAVTGKGYLTALSPAY